MCLSVVRRCRRQKDIAPEHPCRKDRRMGEVRKGNEKGPERGERACGVLERDGSVWR